MNVNEFKSMSVNIDDSMSMLLEHRWPQASRRVTVLINADLEPHKGQKNGLNIERNIKYFVLNISNTTVYKRLKEM